MDGDNLERISVTKLLGAWISEDMFKFQGDLQESLFQTMYD